MRVARDGADDPADERDSFRVPGELARPERRRAAAREGRVDEEDGEDRRDRERDDEPRRAPFAAHAAILAVYASRVGADDWCQLSEASLAGQPVYADFNCDSLKTQPPYGCSPDMCAWAPP